LSQKNGCGVIFGAAAITFLRRQTTMKKQWILIAAAIVLVMALLLGVYFITRPPVQEGSKTITVTVVHADGSEKVFTYDTDAAYLGEVLYAEGLIRNEGADEGMFNVVDGEKADFSVNQSYWALYQGTEYAMFGVDELPIADGDSFRLVYTVYAG
jgi:hypothetical protein